MDQGRRFIPPRCRRHYAASQHQYQIGGWRKFDHDRQAGRDGDWTSTHRTESGPNSYTNDLGRCCTSYWRRDNGWDVESALIPAQSFPNRCAGGVGCCCTRDIGWDLGPNRFTIDGGSERIPPESFPNRCTSGVGSTRDGFGTNPCTNDVGSARGRIPIGRRLYLCHSPRVFLTFILAPLFPA